MPGSRYVETSPSRALIAPTARSPWRDTVKALPSLPVGLKRLANLVAYCAHRFAEDRCSQVAGSLTFTLLLALVPLVTIGLTVVSAFPVFQGLVADVRAFIIANFIPQQASRIITVYFEQFTENAARLTTMGVVILSVTAVLLMFTIEDTFNAIWQVHRPRPMTQRILIYWAMLTLGPILVGASLSLTSFLVGLSSGWARAGEMIDVALLKAAPLLLSAAAFTLLYRTVPNRRVPLAHALAGGLAAALAFEGMKRVFAAYVTAVPTFKLVYGAFASFPIFLTWLYCSWLVVLIGAVIAAALARGRGGVWRVQETPEHRFHDAWTVVQWLAREGAGTPVDFGTLHRHLALPLACLEDALDRLAGAGLVHVVPGRGYVLARPPAAVKVVEIYRLLLPGYPVDEAEYPASAAHGLLAKLDAALDLSVEEALASPPSGRTEAE